MKKIVLVLLMLAVLMCGCGEGESQETQREVSNLYEMEELVEVALNDVEYQIPKKWEETKKESGNNTYYYSDGMMVMIQTSEMDFDNLDNFSEDEKEEAKEDIISGMKEGGKYEELSGNFEEVSGIISIRIKGNGTISGKEGNQDSLIFVQNGIFYNFSIFVYKESNIDYEKDYEKLLESIDIPEQKSESIEGFENASLNYEKFNSPASENGLDGTLVYIDGKVLNQTNLTDSEDPILSIVIEQEDGNRWSVSIASDSEIEEIQGKNVRAFGMYMGFSNVVNLPAIYVGTEDEEIMDKTRIDLEKDGQHVTVWRFSDYIQKQLSEEKEESIESKEIYKDENVIITYTGMSGEENEYKFNYTIENLTEKTLIVQTRETSINGFMVDPMCSIEIAPGKKAQDGMEIWSEDAEKHPMSSVENVETKFHIFNDDDWSDNYDTESVIIVE